MKQSDKALARRYARALFELALPEKALDQVRQDLTVLCGVISSFSDLRKVIQNPTVPRKQQSSLMVGLLERVAGHELTKRFVFLLAKNRRVEILALIKEYFSSIVSEHIGVVSATITSSVVLSEKKVSSIEKDLSKSFGKRVKVEMREDKAILGGVIIEIGSKMLDASLLGKINRLEQISRRSIASI